MRAAKRGSVMMEQAGAPGLPSYDATKAGALARFGRGIAAELDHQPAPPRGQLCEVFQAQSPRTDAADDAVVQSFQRDRSELHHIGRCVGGAADIGEAEYRDRALLRTRYEPGLGLQRDGAGAFGADQCARDVEIVFRQQLIEVVTRDAPLDFRKASPNRLAVAVANVRQSAVNRGASVCGVDQMSKFFIRGGADPHADAVVGEDFQRVDVLDGLAGHDRVRAARIVADHTAQRATAVGGRVRAPGEPMPLGRVAQGVAHHAGFHSGHPSRGIDVQHAIHVLRYVKHDRDVHALAALRRAAAARKQWRLEFPAHGHRGYDVLDRSRNHHPDRDLAVVRRVRCVHRPRAAVEAYLAGNAGPQGMLQSGGVQVRLVVDGGG